MKKREKLKMWWNYHVHDIGKTVYWDNRNDRTFTGTTMQVAFLLLLEVIKWQVGI